MARKKLAPPTSRRRPGRGARQVNFGWWATVGLIVALGVTGIVVSRGGTGVGQITHAVAVPDLTGAETISVSKVNVALFDRVQEGDVLVELKVGDRTETIEAPVTGVVSVLAAAPGQAVEAGTDIAQVQTGPDFANADHWHTAYGVNVCGEWLPPIGEFASDFHSHGDGLVHAHPGSTSAAGRNATLGLFFERAGLELTAAKLEYSDGKTYTSEETTCGEGEDKQTAVLRWALNGEEQEGNPANFVAGNGDVVAIAFLPDKAEFDTLPPSAAHMAESYVPAKHPDFEGPTTPTTFPTDAPAESSPDAAADPTAPPETTETTTAAPTTAPSPTTAGG